MAWRWGLGGAWAEAKAWLASIGLSRYRLYLDGSSSTWVWGRACPTSPLSGQSRPWEWSLSCPKEGALALSLLGDRRCAHLPAAEWGDHRKLMLHPPQLHHCLGLKAKDGKGWVSVRDSPGNHTRGLWEDPRACKEALDPLKRNSLLRLFYFCLFWFLNLWFF